MRLFMPVLMSVCCAMLLAHEAWAETPSSQLQDPAKIRQIYEGLSGDWPRIPEFVRTTVQVSQDKNFHHHPADRSAIALQIGRWLETPHSQTGETNSRVAQQTGTSLAIGQALSHDEILDWYLNAVPLGQGCTGIPDAAMAYFGKSVEDLRLEETAYLAALIAAPERFHPHNSRDQAVKRRNFLLLSVMAKGGFIPMAAAQQAANAPLAARYPLGACATNN